MTVQLSLSVSDTSIEIVAEETNGFRDKIKALGKLIFQFAYLIFQSLGKIFEGKFSAAYWNSKQFCHLKHLPPFCFSPIPPFSLTDHFPEQFYELAEVYQEINGIQHLEKDLNLKLKKGYCFAQCLGLVHLTQINSSIVEEEIQHLASLIPTLTLYQILEIFRECFERENRQDLLNKIQTLYPQGNQPPKRYPLESKESLQSLLLDSCHLKNGLFVTSLFDRVSSHSVLLEVNTDRQVYGFFDSNLSGYYSYDSLEDLVDALVSYVQSHTPLLKANQEGWVEFLYYSS